MRRFLVRALAVIGAMTVLIGLGFVLVLVAALRHRPSVPATTLLETEFQRGIGERKERGLLEAFGKEKPTLRDIVDGLEKASTDSHVAVLVSDLSHFEGGLAQVQEIRDAVIAFRKKGKRAVAFADSFGELGPANGAYYLATAYDEIYIQPSGSVGLTGVGIEVPFARELLDKVGVKPSFFKRKEYKSAPESLTEKEISAASREQSEALLDSEVSQLIRGVAEGRNLKEAQVKALLDRGPLLAEEAQKEKLVDGLAYRDEVYTKLRARAGTGAKPLYLSVYLERSGRPNADAPNEVALIYGTGNVERGAPGGDELSGDRSMRSGDVVAAFREAVAESKIKAIVFRIDSPGGSYVASDTIRRAVELARKAGKPVIVSMGNVAASGGYFVAMDADKVVAEPGTITGSIGVFAGKMITAELWSKLGVRWTTIARGTNAALMSSNSDFTPEQRQRMDAWLDAVYADFTQKAAAGRNLPLAKLQELAKGRVWSGEDAKKRGLVDALGGMETAMRLAKEAAKIDADTPARFEVYPREKNPIEQLAEVIAGRTGDSSEAETEAMSVAVPEPRWARTLGALAHEVGLGEPAAPLRATTPEVRW